MIVYSFYIPMQSQFNSHRIPSNPHKIPIQSHQIPIKSHQIPIKSHQIPIKSHQIPIISHLIPIKMPMKWWFKPPKSPLPMPWRQFVALLPPSARPGGLKTIQGDSIEIFSMGDIDWDNLIYIYIIYISLWIQTLSEKVLNPPNYSKLYPKHFLRRYLDP